MKKVYDALGEGCGIGTVKSTEHIDEELDKSYLAKLKFADDFEVKKSTAKDCKIAVSYKAYVFNPPVLLKKLTDYLKDLGVTIKKQKLASINDTFLLSTKVVFNCTGNGASTLAGVDDKKMVPTRGQVVVIRAPYINECVLAWTDTSTYVIKRPDSNLDEVILGGFYQPNISTNDVYGFETEDILQRATQLFPGIIEKNPAGKTIEDLQILRVVSGIRPGRETGVRIEKENIGSKTIIHNYGAGGNGYLCGLGMAQESVDLLDV